MIFGIKLTFCVLRGEKKDFRACLLAESGLFCMFSGRKWTFLLPVWEKVNFLCDFEKKGTQLLSFWEKVDFFAWSPPGLGHVT